MLEGLRNTLSIKKNDGKTDNTVNKNTVSKATPTDRPIIKNDQKPTSSPVSPTPKSTSTPSLSPGNSERHPQNNSSSVPPASSVMDLNLSEPENRNNKSNEDINNKKAVNNSHIEHNKHNNEESKMSTLSPTPANKITNKASSRVLPPLIEELLEKKVSVGLTINGYTVGGFYGAGSIRLIDTDEKDVFVAIDHRDKKHTVKSFHDLLVLNKEVWRAFYKKDPAWRKADPAWFDYMLDAGLLEITPAK